MNAEELARDAARVAASSAEHVEIDLRYLIATHGPNEFAEELRKCADRLRFIARTAESDARRLARKAP